MSRIVQILSLFFCIQILAVFWVYNKKDSVAKYVKKDYLLSLKPDSIDKISLVDDEKNSVNLVKNNNSWIAPEKENFLIVKSKVDQFIKQILALKRSRYVGKTQISAKQFAVTEEKFERKIEFFSKNQKIARIYFGTSPSFRKVHVKLEEEDLTYTVSYNINDVDTKIVSWLDQEIVKMDKDKVKKIHFHGKELTLVQNNKKFVVSSELVENSNEDKISSIVEDVSNIGFDDVLEKGYKYGKEVLKYSLDFIDNKSKTFTFYSDIKDSEKEDSKSKNYIYKISGLDYLFTIKHDKIESLLVLKKEDLASSVSGNVSTNIDKTENKAN
jgi:hypothetical protein